MSFLQNSSILDDNGNLNAHFWERFRTHYDMTFTRR